MNKFFKKKTGKCQWHATNIISCLFHAADIYQFIFSTKNYQNLNLFFEFFNIFLEKSEVFKNKFFKKKTGKCQWHATNIISCLFHAADIYQFIFSTKNYQNHHFFFNFSTFFLKKVKCLRINFFKKKLVNVSSMQQT